MKTKCQTCGDNKMVFDEHSYMNFPCSDCKDNVIDRNTMPAPKAPLPFDNETWVDALGNLHRVANEKSGSFVKALNGKRADKVCAHIAAQAEKIAELEDERDVWKNAAANTRKEADDYAQQIKTLEAREQRLREALESIAASACCGSCQEASLVAKAALAQTGGE